MRGIQNRKNKISTSGLDFDAKNLDSEYSIKGDAPWKPLRVFNDGIKTYIQVPEKTKMFEAPILLTINNGEESLVNYRLHDDLFIVDKLFAEAILVSGVGKHQQKIKIESKNAWKKTEEDDGRYAN